MKNNSVLVIITKFVQFILFALLFLTPLLVIPYTRNLIVDAKLFLLFFVAIIVMISFATKTLVKKRWEIAISPLTKLLLFFGLAVLFSTLLTNRYPVEGLLGMGGAYLGFVLIGIFGSSLIKGDHTKTIIRLLGISGALLSVSMFLQHWGWGANKLFNAISAFNLPNNLLFNLSGSSLVAMQVTALALVGIVSLIKLQKKATIIEWVLGTLNLAGFGLGLWSILPGKIAVITLLPFRASWTVMLRSLESWQTALIGYGPTAYSNAFTMLKPLWINGKNYWQVNFGSATNTPLTLIVTLGVIGLATWLFLAIQVIKQRKNTDKETQPLLWMLIGSFIIQLLIPNNLVLLTLQAGLLVFLIAANQKRFSLLRFQSIKLNTNSTGRFEFLKRLFKKGDWLVKVTAILLIIIASGFAYGVGRAYVAQHLLYKADKALTEQNIVQSYDYQRRAVATNPYLDSLRRNYAQTNLQIAIALSNKVDITELEAQQITQLIEQAVGEGRAATILDKLDVENWFVLSGIYSNLIGAADEADTWAINTLVTARQINPTNPFIFLELGRLTLINDKPQEAVLYFSQAVELKPDLPVAHYQLGVAFQALDQLENTRIAWQQALQLLPETTEDYLTLSQQLEALEEIMLERAANSAETIKVDETTSTPNITQQNVSQQESDLVKPGDDALLELETEPKN